MKNFKYLFLLVMFSASCFAVDIMNYPKQSDEIEALAKMHFKDGKIVEMRNRSMCFNKHACAEKTRNLITDLYDSKNSKIYPILKLLKEHQNKNLKFIDQLLMHQLIYWGNKKKNNSFKDLYEFFSPFQVKPPSTKKSIIKTGYMYKLCGLVGTRRFYKEPNVPFKENVSGLIGCDVLKYQGSYKVHHYLDSFNLIKKKGNWAKFATYSYKDNDSLLNQYVPGREVWLKLDEIASFFTIENKDERIFVPFNSFDIIKTDQNKYMLVGSKFIKDDIWSILTFKTHKYKNGQLEFSKGKKENMEELKKYRKALDKSGYEFTVSESLDNYKLVQNPDLTFQGACEDGYESLRGTNTLWPEKK